MKDLRWRCGAGGKEQLLKQGQLQDQEQLQNS
jgi:hypothetical protein